MNRTLTLNKVVALAVLGAFALLMIELRYNHRNVLGEHWQSWIPLVYSGTMIVAGAVAVAAWERGGRIVLFWGFALALGVGGVGFWMHNDGKPQRGVARELSAWTLPIEAGHHHHDDEAPPFEVAPTSDQGEAATSEAATSETDAGHADAGHADAGHADAGHADAGHADAGHAATSETDAGHADAGHADAGHADAGHDESGDSHHDGADGHDEAALDAPPALAPLSFAGLGLLGMLACARRFAPSVRNEK